MLSTRFARIGCILIILAAAVPARAELPFASGIPANAIMVVGIGDAGATWNRARPLPLFGALNQYLQSPALSDDLDFQAFLLERKKLELALGYPATADAFMGGVFRNFLFYAVPGPAGEKIPSVVIMMTAADKAKVARLVQVLDQKNKGYAQASAAPTTSTLPVNSATFERFAIGEASVSHFVHLAGSSGDAGQPSGDVREGYYTLAGDRFVFATRRIALSAALAGLPAGAPNLASNPDYARLTSVLPVDKADIVGWFDADYLTRFVPYGAMLKAMPGVSRSNKMAWVVSMVSDGVLVKGATTAEPTRDAPGFKPGKLAGLAFVGPTPLAAAVSGAFDPSQLLSQLDAFKAMPGMLGGAGAPAGGDPLTEFEQSSGISIQQELIPALGGEYVMALNKVDPLHTSTVGFFSLPTVDMAVCVKLKDSAKMAGVMRKLEKVAEKRVNGGVAPPAAGAGAGAPPGMVFESVPAGSVEIRRLPFSEGIAPSYAIFQGFLIIGLNTASVGEALNRAVNQAPSISASPVFRDLARFAGDNANLYSYSMVDVSQIVSVMGGFLPMLLANKPPAAQQQILALCNGVLIHAGTVAAVEMRENDIPVSFGKMTMR